ncbi:MAG: hypothetical protein IT562_21945 [Alphaproteobacteria bacterium]|nr:hypothetical protein [Alphaproteobacteria bacterium]
MTVTTPTRRDQLLAIGILVLVLAAAWLIVIWPIIEAFGDLKKTIANSQRIVLEFEARGAAVPDLRYQLDQVRKTQLAETGYVEGPNPAAASSALQATARRVLEMNGAALRSLQALPPNPEGTAQRIAIRVDATIPGSRLLDLLYELRAASPSLFADNFDLRVPDSVATAPLSAPRADLAMRVDIHAYFRTSP